MQKRKQVPTLCFGITEYFEKSVSEIGESTVAVDTVIV